MTLRNTQAKSGLVELDDFGYGVQSGDGAFLRVSLGEGVLIVQTARNNTSFPGSCVAPTFWTCAGLYTTGI